MKSRTARGIAALLVLATATLADASPAEKPFIGWIPAQPVDPGSTLELDMRRFHEPTATSVLAAPADGRGFTSSYDPESLTLRVEVASDATGPIDIPIDILANPEAESPAASAILTITVNRPGNTLLSHRAPEAGEVFVAGSFNGWNQSANPLAQTSPGTFETRLDLPPGNHEYKFIVDGEWIADPSNPERAGDNSLLAVPPDTRAPAPLVFLESTQPDQLVFRLDPMGAGTGSISVVLQKPDGTSSVAAFSRDGNQIIVPVDGAPENSWIRVIASNDQGATGLAARGRVRPDDSFQWQDGILYYAFTDRFIDGDPSNNQPVDDDRVLPQANYLGGDFAGIEQRLEQGYFRDLGINILWLAPLNTNPPGAWQEYLPPYRHYTGYHGYWPISDTEVEPRFGGNEGLASLVKAAHANETRIIADLVLKHVHLENPLWTSRREWFGTVDLPDGTKNLRRWDDHQFTTWFEEWLPGFDFDNPEAVDFLIDNAEFWVKQFDLDGYRLDAVKHIQFSFWPTFRTAMRDLSAAQGRRPGSRYYVGETFMDREGIMSFVGPNMLDGQFDFPLYDTIMDVLARRSHGFEDLETSLTASETIYGKETLMSPLVGNHDKSRFMAYADGDLPHPSIEDEEEVGWADPPQVDDPVSYDYLKLATSFILAIDGVPMIYYGDEVGLTGAGDPDNRRMMPLEDSLDPAQESVREHFKKSAAARHAHPALRYGSRRALVAAGDRYAFVRRHLDDAVLCVWNRADSDSDFTVDVSPEMVDGTYRDALSDRAIEVLDGKSSFTLPPRSVAFFTK